MSLLDTLVLVNKTQDRPLNQRGRTRHGSVEDLVHELKQIHGSERYTNGVFLFPIVFLHLLQDLEDERHDVLKGSDAEGRDQFVQTVLVAFVCHAELLVLLVLVVHHIDHLENMDPLVT